MRGWVLLESVLGGRVLLGCWLERRRRDEDVGEDVINEIVADSCTLDDCAPAELMLADTIFSMLELNTGVTCGGDDSL